MLTQCLYAAGITTTLTHLVIDAVHPIPAQRFLPVNSDHINPESEQTEAKTGSMAPLPELHVNVSGEGSQLGSFTDVAVDKPPVESCPLSLQTGELGNMAYRTPGFIYSLVLCGIDLTVPTGRGLSTLQALTSGRNRLLNLRHVRGFAAAASPNWPRTWQITTGKPVLNRSCTRAVMSY